ncbi:MAG: glycosyltransferase involved in cell wall biosynthesis [Cryomorphaceae bacterium]|jgi:glycosyltransferase involved in cell wall biosynthesis
MKIAVNTRLLLKDKMEGIGWFTFETLKRITASHPEIDFIFIFDRKPSQDFIFSENVQAVVAHPQSRHPILWYLFFEFGVYRVLKKHKPDLFLSPDGWLSLRSNTPQLAVIHDLNFEKHPEFVPFLVRKYYLYFFPRFAKKARRLTTVSEYSKRDIVNRYGVDKDKVDVVYNGVNDVFRVHNDSEIAAIRNQFTGGAPYFLFVGLIHHRKNLKNQLLAFLKFKLQHSIELKYVIVGEKFWWDNEIDEVLKNSEFRDDVIFLGRRGMDDLVALYGGAFALTYASFFEGFGIPIIEAFKSGVPVITSNTSSMPEVADKGAILVDPDSVSEIAAAMKMLVENDSKRESLIVFGKERAKKFAWENAAEGLWSSIQKALS